MKKSCFPHMYCVRVCVREGGERIYTKYASILHVCVLTFRCLFWCGMCLNCMCVHKCVSENLWEALRSQAVRAPGIKGGMEGEDGSLSQLLFNWRTGREAGERERAGSVLIKLEGPIQTFYTDRDAGFTCLGWGEHSLASWRRAEEQRRECVCMCVCACEGVRVFCHQQLTPLRQTAGMRVHCMSLEYQWTIHTRAHTQSHTHTPGPQRSESESII